ncbi:MAG: right-handed parallel beta-helix repeat-containing protein [Clostridia bacterium]|nr:right-handed parallel beta-helix repeat-containing protein [Clostridia bacterium]
MKKIIALMLCFVMLLSLIACSTDGDDASTTTTTTTAPTTTTTTTNTTVGAKEELVYSDWDKSGYHIYVSEDGFDYNDGSTPEKAVETIYRANELAADYINGETPDKQDVIISFEEGNYYIPTTVKMVTGTEEVGIYYTSRGGRAYFVGGINIKPYEIMKCNDTEIANKVKDEDARNNLYEVDLTNYTRYLTDFLANPANLNGTTVHNSIEFYVGNYNLQPSRFPDKDYQAGDTTAVGVDMPGSFAITYINYMKDGQFVSVDEIADYSTTPLNIFLTGETYEKVKSWDVANEKIYIEDTLNNNYTITRHYVTSFTDTRYSFDGNVTYYDGYVTLHTGRGSNGAVGLPSNGGSYSEFRRAYFFNIIEEINDPGEFYYDEADKKLYVYLDETMSANDLYVATLGTQAFNIEGQPDSLIQNIHFVNMGFRYSQSDWMHMKNATNITVSGCLMGLNAGLAVFTQNATNLTFKDSIFEQLGTGVFRLWNTAWGDHDDDGVYDLANVLVENCILRDISEQKVDYRPAFGFFKFSGITVRHCTVSEGGHAAVQYSEAANLLFEYNEWYGFMTETDDGGLSYSGMADATTMTGTVWRYNLIHDIGSSWQPWGVRVFYSDADSALYTIHDNVIYNFMQGEAKGVVFHNVHGGKIYNNIIMNTAEDVYIMTDYIYPDIFTDLMRSLRADTVSDIYSGTFYYLNFEKADESGDTAARKELYSSDVFDDDFKFHFERFEYLRSDKYLYDMFSRGYAVISPYTRQDSTIGTSSSESAHNGGTVVIDDSTIEDFVVRLAQNVAGKSKGDYTFNSVDEMTGFLVQLGYKGASDAGKMPVGVSILYNGERVLFFYYNLLAAGSPEAVSEWVLSDAAIAAQATDSTITNNIDTLFSQHRGWAHYVYRAAIYSKFAYTGLYYNNLTINVGLDLSTPVPVGNTDVYWDSVFAKSGNCSDYDDIDIEMLDENGEYTVDFIDLITDIIDNDQNLQRDEYGEAVLKLLDLSNVGASLGK